MKKITRNELRKIINESLTSGMDPSNPMADLASMGADLAGRGAKTFNKHSHPYMEANRRLTAEAVKRGEALGSMLKPENIAEIREHITNTSRKSQGSYYNALPPGALGLNELSSDIVGSDLTLPDLFPVLSDDHDHAVDYFTNHEDKRNTSIISWMDEQKAMIAQAYYSALIRAATANGLKFVPSTSRGSDFVQAQEAHRLAYGYLIAP